MVTETSETVTTQEQEYNNSVKELVSAIRSLTDEVSNEVETCKQYMDLLTSTNLKDREFHADIDIQTIKRFLDCRPEPIHFGYDCIEDYDNQVETAFNKVINSEYHLGKIEPVDSDIKEVLSKIADQVTEIENDASERYNDLEMEFQDMENFVTECPRHESFEILNTPDLSNKQSKEYIQDILGFIESGTNNFDLSYSIDESMCDLANTVNEFVESDLYKEWNTSK